MMKGPAPTGSCANAFSPIFLNEVSEMIQFGIESNIWLMNAPSGTGRLTWILVGSITLMTPGAGAEEGFLGSTRLTIQLVGAQVQADCRSRVQFQATTSAVSGLPSENLTFGRRLMVTVLLPLEYLYPVARS